MTATLPPPALDSLLPMHLLIDSKGQVVGAGRALQRLYGDHSLKDAQTWDILTFEHPVSVPNVKCLAGRRVAVQLRNAAATHLRGHGVATGNGFVILNLTLALGELQHLQDTGLTAEDFAPTDPTLDMLYLIEAKTLATAETHRLIDRLQSARTTAETQATTDPLTGLMNRRGFDLVLSRAIAEQKPFSLAHVDLDHFKAVNDRLGHPAGDAVLVAVARRLREIVRASDTVARVGGDEFTIVLHRLTDRETLDNIARRIVTELERPVPFDGKICRVSASLGIAISKGGDVHDAETMIADADTALYASKAAGRARHTFKAAGAVS